MIVTAHYVSNGYVRHPNVASYERPTIEKPYFTLSLTDGAEVHIPLSALTSLHAQAETPLA